MLGPISPKALSGGVKTLMLMAFDENDRVFNASVCGDNCAKWIMQIAENKDLTINLRHIMDFGEGKFEAKVLNTNQIVHNMQEFLVTSFWHLTHLLLSSDKSSIPYCFCDCPFLCNIAFNHSYKNKFIWDFYTPPIAVNCNH